VGGQGLDARRVPGDHAQGGEELRQADRLIVAVALAFRREAWLVDFRRILQPFGFQPFGLEAFDLGPGDGLRRSA
jgi:hypothetical protein